MSPCPFVNALANHNLLPRSGISSDDIKAALATMECDATIQTVFSGSTAMKVGSTVHGKQQLTLAQLSYHNSIEHDASLTRQDANVGSHVQLDMALLGQLLSMSTDGVYITKTQLAKYRALREAHSRTYNPAFTFGPRQQFLAYGEAALLVLALRDSTGHVRVDWLRMVLEQEKLPFDLKWRTRPICIADVLGLAGELRGEAFEWGGCAHSTPGGADQFTNWTESDATNVSPCPFLNAFANHGLLPRTGITVDNIKSALTIFQVDEALQKLFTGSTITSLGSVAAAKEEGATEDAEPPKTLSLSSLGQHNAMEHDASLTRPDAGLGDSVKLDSALLDQLVALSADGQYITKAHIGHFRAIREEHSKANNDAFVFDAKQQFLAYAEAALLLLALRDSTGNIKVDWLKLVFEQEKLPLELGWEVRPITADEVLGLASELRGGDPFDKSVFDQFN
ncbi:hypothetical protein DYB25_009593 [Aphanomyces astaci]|uniref:Heme haloperoxidase family profile domain-containing protein n=1 Tax=Aphanomyces astaci TaxID=112090 RepID=A0A397AGX8_APHAT|nr:hypothetical protein DYB25_009593 [Aphanomyces astaci]